MKVILHVGMPKSGSTSLQRYLNQSRGELRAAGVEYPAVHNRYNHGYLVAGLPSLKDKPPREYIARYSDERYLDYLTLLRRNLEESRCNTAVISTEYLFRELETKDLEVIRSIFPEEAEIEIVLYVKDPASYYLGNFQQQLKASYTLRPPQGMRYKEIITSLMRLSGTIHVRSFETESLIGGDVVSDFINEFLPQCRELLQTSPPLRENETVSAEGMCLLHDYRWVNHRMTDNLPTPDSNRILQTIQAVEEEMISVSRPVLRPNIAQQVLGQTPDIQWLRDSFGISFKSVDYDILDTFLPTPIPQPQAVSDICFVDEGTKREILMRVLKVLADQ